ncbi:MAG: hypothetical protein STSR0009_01400 [Methanoregula sp.]
MLVPGNAGEAFPIEQSKGYPDPEPVWKKLRKYSNRSGIENFKIPGRNARRRIYESLYEMCCLI